MDGPTPAGVPEAILVPRGGKPMLPSRPAIAVRPRRSTLLVGILLCLIVALALILLIVAPALAQKKLAKEGEELVRHMDGSVAPRLSGRCKPAHVACARESGEGEKGTLMVPGSPRVLPRYQESSRCD